MGHHLRDRQISLRLMLVTSLSFWCASVWVTSSESTTTNMAFAEYGADALHHDNTQAIHVDFELVDAVGALTTRSSSATGDRLREKLREPHFRRLIVYRVCVALAFSILCGSAYCLAVAMSPKTSRVKDALDPTHDLSACDDAKPIEIHSSLGDSIPLSWPGGYEPQTAFRNWLEPVPDAEQVR